MKRYVHLYVEVHDLRSNYNFLTCFQDLKKLPEVPDLTRPVCNRQPNCQNKAADRKTEHFLSESATFLQRRNH